MDSTSVWTPDGGAHDDRVDDESSVPNLDSAVRLPIDWRRHAASNDADDGSMRGHGLATTPNASAALIFRLPLSMDSDLLLTASRAGEVHRLPAEDRNDDLVVESLDGSGGELFLSTTTAASAGKLPRFSANGDDDDDNEDVAMATFMALSEW